MLAQLTAAFRQGGVRRALSVVFAVTFLSFTFIHATHHCGVAAESSVQIEITALDGSSDGPDKSPEAEHCCNCSTAAMIAAESALPATAISPRVETALWRTPHPFVPAAEIRPPIA
jgi:hypothetical protein